MDGLWNTAVGVESTPQGRLSRHRLLRVNMSNSSATTPLINPGDASSCASIIPNAQSGEHSGPHFILSPYTPDNSPTYGFEFALFGSTLFGTAGAGGQGVVFPAGGLSVTVWALIGTMSDPQASQIGTELWASMATLTGVGEAAMFHSFDMNAGAIRFQITGSANDAANQSVLIAFCEL